MSIYKVPGWELGDMLGMGRLGPIFAARETTSSGRPAALRVVSSSPFFDGADGTQRFLRDAGPLPRLGHPSAVPVLSAGLTADPSRSPYLAVEYVQGTSLRSGRAALSFEAKVETVLQVLGALEAAHGLGVYHRNVRPSNVLLRQGRPAALMDFGLGWLWESLPSKTLPTELLDAMPYAPPETSFEGPSKGPGHDVYSCAVLLYELLMGERPDPQRPPTPPSTVSQELVGLDHVLGRALGPQEGRYATAAALADDLRGWRERGGAVKGLGPSPRLEGLRGRLEEERSAASEALEADRVRQENIRLKLDGRHNVVAAAGLQAFKDARRQLSQAGRNYGFEAIRPDLALAEDPQGGVTPYFAVVLPGGRRLVFGSSPDWSRPLGEPRAAPLFWSGGEQQPAVHWLGPCWVVYLEGEGGIERELRGIVCAAVPSARMSSPDPEVQLYADRTSAGHDVLPPRLLATPDQVYDYLLYAATCAI